MDHVPFRRAEPFLDVLQSPRRGSAVDRNAVDVGLPHEKFPRGDRVTDRNRVANEKHPRQSGNVLDRAQRRVGTLGGLSGRDGWSGVGGQDIRHLGRRQTQCQADGDEQGDRAAGMRHGNGSSRPTWANIGTPTQRVPSNRNPPRTPGPADDAAPRPTPTCGPASSGVRSPRAFCFWMSRAATCTTCSGPPKRPWLTSHSTASAQVPRRSMP